MVGLKSPLPRKPESEAFTFTAVQEPTEVASLLPRQSAAMYFVHILSETKVITSESGGTKVATSKEAGSEELTLTSLLVG